jgi:hypothetical protein
MRHRKLVLVIILGLSM